MKHQMTVTTGGVKGISGKATVERKLDGKFPAGMCWECVAFQPRAPDDGT